MEIRNFITFKKIIETGSFTKTSEELGYAQSTITAHIQAIEDYLSGQVFDRIGRQVILTDLGRQLEKQVDSCLTLTRKSSLFQGTDKVQEEQYGSALRSPLLCTNLHLCFKHIQMPTPPRLKSYLLMLPIGN